MPEDFWTTWTPQLLDISSGLSKVQPWPKKLDQIELYQQKIWLQRLKVVWALLLTNISDYFFLTNFFTDYFWPFFSEFSQIDGCVKIRKTNEWPANRETISIPTIFKKSCISAGNITALGVKRGGKWVTWSYLDYLRDVEIVAKAFIALGLEPHNAVCIFGMIFLSLFFCW